MDGFVEINEKLEILGRLGGSLLVDGCLPEKLESSVGWHSIIPVTLPAQNPPRG